MSNKKRVNLNLPKVLVDKIDEAIGNSGGVIQNRTHFILLASSEKLKNISKPLAGVEYGV